MRSRRILIIVLIVLFLMGQTGCGFFGKDEPKQEELEKNSSGENDEVTEEEPVEETSQTTQVKMRQTVFYYVNQEGFLEPFMMEIPWVTGIGKSAVKHLIDAPEIREKLEGTGLKPVLPEGTEILGLAIKENGLARIDFNEKFLNTKSLQEERNAVKAVVYTLTEFPTVSKVRFMIGGKFLQKLPHGTYIGEPLNRADFE